MGFHLSFDTILSKRLLNEFDIFFCKIINGLRALVLLIFMFLKKLNFNAI